MNIDQTQIQSSPNSSLPVDNDSYRHNLTQGDELYFQGRYNESYAIYKQIYDQLSYSESDSISDMDIICHKLGLALMKKGIYEESRQFLLKAYDLRKNGKKEESLETVQLLNSIGEVYLAQAKHAEAHDHFQWALTLLEKTCEASHDEFLTCYNNFANLCKSQEKPQTALNYLQKAVDFVSKHNKKLDKELSMTYYLYADVYSSLAEYSQVLKYVMLSLQIREDLYGKGNHPDTALCYNILGHIAYYQGRHPEALQTYKIALEIRMKFLDEFHPSIAGSYNNIAIVEESLGNHVTALKNYNKALEIEINCFGENHPNVASSYNNIGDLYRQQKRYVKSEKYFTKALELQTQHLGTKHPSVAYSHYNLGLLYEEQNKYHKSLDHFLKSFKIQQKVFENYHPEMSDSFNVLGRLFRNIKNISSSKACFEKRHQVDKTGHGINHQKTRKAKAKLEEMEKVGLRLYRYTDKEYNI